MPPWATNGAFTSLTRTDDELSILCPQDVVPDGVKSDSGWVCLKLEGPFPFSQTGVLSSFIGPLSGNAIPIFALSTYDTDYVLIKQGHLTVSLEVLRAAGHQLLGSK